MLDFELHNNFKVHIKIPKEEYNVNDIVFFCKSLSTSISQSFFEKILYKIQSQILDHFLGVSWHSERFLATPWVCPRCGNRSAFNRRGKRKRSLKSTMGVLHFYLLQVTCLHCDKTFSPFPRLLGIDSRHWLTKELERSFCTLVKDYSYSVTSG